MGERRRIHVFAGRAATVLVLLSGSAAPAPGGEPPPAHCSDDRVENICWVPPGDFWMGRTRLWLIDEISWQTRDRVDARPVHRVTLPGFWIDQKEVTQESYREFTWSTGRPEPFHWRQGFPEDKAGLPVYNVNWSEASEYCAFRQKRLPTEAEWEKAARGGLQGAAWPWGSQYRADPDEDAPEGTPRPSPPARLAHPRAPTDVASHPPNGYGLFDMVGNIAEWVADGYDLGYYAVSPFEDPRGPEAAPYRIFRGGSWADTDERIASVHYRNFTRPDARIHSIGFRCALDHPTQGATE